MTKAVCSRWPLARKLFLERADGRLVQFLRYAVVSGLTLLLDFGLLYLATEKVGLHYLVSAAASYSVGVVLNYVLSAFWAFPRSRLRSRLLEFLVFVAIGLAGMGLNELLLWLLTEKAGFHYLVSRSIAAVIGYSWKFVLRKVVLFP